MSEVAVAPEDDNKPLLKVYSAADMREAFLRGVALARGYIFNQTIVDVETAEKEAMAKWPN